MAASKFARKLKSLITVSCSSGVLLGLLLYRENDEKFFSNFLMPTSRFLFSQKTCNKLALFFCKWNLLPRNDYVDSYRLTTNICGIELNNCIGLAAGFDRNGDAIKNLHKLGFSFIEIGTITPEPIEDELIKYVDDKIANNRYDSINKGIAYSVPKMRNLRRKEEYTGIIGFNIGKNSNSSFLKDISLGIKVYSPVANYITINIESEASTNPSEILKQKENLREVLTEVNKARLLFDIEKQRPIFLKLSPELTLNELKDIIEVTKEKNCKVHGFIISNTRLKEKKRNENPEGKYKAQAIENDENISLREKSTQMLKDVYKLTNGKSTLIGVGEITCGQDAYEKILAGASAVQIFSSFIDHGPPIINKIKRELNDLLQENGYENVKEAVGKEVKLENKGWFNFFRFR
ncbi:hypothetical protein PVAND_004804 [Polypedilum vanderplanki]|uniref:Dihydroorotate dehydrogenase catalytic domain-containing protein n=1 Tax=Polypedilum vanderplanki TaxID=319348 RepID=A0A9J6BZ70_POLVA|nr:hypothetical protein PVAND_004804 [Polypedilum vanderplanki]